ncbi:MAG: hypothetical protein LC672_06020, partial [Acidobacteria bacterium]|nr:hypothetical protein [Acidobacteriota bacterium]
MLLVTMAVAGVMATRRGQERGMAQRSDKRQFDRSRFPIADYAAPEPADPEQRAKRRAKGSRYDKRGVIPPPHYKNKGAGVQEHNDWDRGFPPLPVAQSDAVVIGEIVNAQAYLSNDKSGVYSEFSLRVDEVLKSGPSQFAPGGSVIAEREGGRVKYPDGEVALFTIVGQNMPLAGRRYVLFLKSNGDGQGYRILTGYELREGRI